MASDKFELPKDPELRLTAGIVLGSLAFLVLVSVVFRDVNPA